ncbi:TPA: hypothetical protein ACGIKA_002888 [Acinetobacter baumannii]|uniref:hypothetical protein n=1 Tax=Acinetobacter baumannii TaxID=470 RepID=UPI00338E9E0B
MKNFKISKNFTIWIGGLGWILLIITLWTVFPLIFAFFSKILFNFTGLTPKYFGENYGAVGDIYGSLNTLISSLALCAVAYSTYLQIKELRLSRQTYEDQLSESKYSNFTSLFYSLFNNKQLNYKNLVVKKDRTLYEADDIFVKNGREIMRLIVYEWKGEIPDKETVRKKYIDFNREEFGPFLTSQLISYFSIYGDLFYLINKSDFLEQDKQFFKRLVINSMSNHEQGCLLWVSAFNSDINQNLKGSEIFKIGYSPEVLKFMKKFYDKSYSGNPEITENWTS